MKCPTCGQPAKWQDNPHRPFCSERCQLIDFGKWANEEYRVPGERAPLADEREDAARAAVPESDGRK
ncbi:MAG TPA: DNA gyrase inhibitor YacG [Pyrinomonadaceae bacterium]|jgi:hypothetical protein